MASLPNTPFTDIEDFRVAVDAPVSTDLMTDIVVDLNYLLGVLSDGAASPQALIDTNCLTLRGPGVCLNVDNDADIAGTLTVGSFVVPETGLIFVNITPQAA